MKGRILVKIRNRPERSNEGEDGGDDGVGDDEWLSSGGEVAGRETSGQIHGTKPVSYVPNGPRLAFLWT